MSETAERLKFVLGVYLRSDPARESRFHTVQLPRELCEFPPDTDEWKREGLHRHVNTEVQSAEIAAQSLVDFPDAPWELRMQYARQCWDETRHAKLIHRQLAAAGGFLGEFPIINYDWGIACALSTVTQRLAVQNRTVEAGEMDLLRQLRDGWEASGDAGLASVMDGILADEIQHVRFANQWIQTEVRKNPRLILQIAAAIDFVRNVTQAFTPGAGELNRVGIEMASLDRSGFEINLADRKLAGFSDDDLAVLQTSSPFDRGI